jgi:hypothetical protein
MLPKCLLIGSYNMMWRCRQCRKCVRLTQCPQGTATGRDFIQCETEDVSLCMQSLQYLFRPGVWIISKNTFRTCSVLPGFVHYWKWCNNKAKMSYKEWEKEPCLMCDFPQKANIICLSVSLTPENESYQLVFPV